MSYQYDNSRNLWTLQRVIQDCGMEADLLNLYVKIGSYQYDHVNMDMILSYQYDHVNMDMILSYQYDHSRYLLSLQRVIQD